MIFLKELIAEQKGDRLILRPEITGDIRAGWQLCYPFALGNLVLFFSDKYASTLKCLISSSYLIDRNHNYDIP